MKRGEAERLQAHFFDVLLTRSENSREEALSGVMWPRCIVCTTMDLEVLRQAVFAEEMSETSVDSRHLLMKRFPPAPAPTVVVCWPSCDRPCRRLVIRSGALQRTSHGKMRASERCVFKMHEVGAVNAGRLHRGWNISLLPFRVVAQFMCRNLHYFSLTRRVTFFTTQKHSHLPSQSSSRCHFCACFEVEDERAELRSWLLALVTRRTSIFLRMEAYHMGQKYNHLWCRHTVFRVTVSPSDVVLEELPG